MIRMNLISCITSNTLVTSNTLGRILLNTGLPCKLIDTFGASSTTILLGAAERGGEGPVRGERFTDWVGKASG